jgi:glycosyltransferase involved in cell wall biosynthesis
MRIAVVIATYNRPDALAALLDAYQEQDDEDFEVIVADDGSTYEVGDLVRARQARARFPLAHLWHEDRGFRAAKMRNRAVASTAAEYVIFTDGDCIPSRSFVSRHRRLARRGCFLSGNRVLLSEAFTARVLTERIPVQSWGPAQWVRAWVRGDVNRWLPALTLPDGTFRMRGPRHWRGVKTCNLSAWRADLLAVNGLDETYAGKWGLEDSDLVIRLLHSGVRHKSARFAAPVYHLWHRENDKRGFAENQRLLAELLASTRARAPLGIDQYL